MARIRVVGIAFVVLSLAIANAKAADSSYSSIAPKACRSVAALKIDGTEYAASRVCPGRGGYKVYVDEEDLRETLSVGKTLRQAVREPAAADRFGAFNSYEDTVEWRLRAGGTPYALIAGWAFADNDHPDAAGRPKSARLLVVMRLPPGPVCKIAYVDRAANNDANALARKAADAIAPNFKCGSDTPIMIGTAGAAAAAFARLRESRTP
jgi:hypothetical protein